MAIPWKCIKMIKEEARALRAQFCGEEIKQSLEYVEYLNVLYFAQKILEPHRTRKYALALGMERVSSFELQGHSRFCCVLKNAAKGS